MKMNKEDFEIGWWHDWFEADCIERREMVEKLPALRELMEIKEDVPLFLKRAYHTLINGLFEDLVDYMYARERLEEDGKEGNKKDN